MQKEVTPAFYESSFQQLSDIQQRQVGSIVGASVADAAARAVDGATPQQIEALVPRLSQRYGSTAQHDAPAVELAFLPASIAPTTLPMAGPLAFHSLPHATMAALLGTLATNKAVLDPELFAMSMASVRSVLPKHAAEFARHATLYEACAVIPIASIYPYAAESDLMPYLELVLGTIHDTAFDPRIEVEGELPDPWLPTNERPFRHSFDASCAVAQATTGLLTRYMMRNPDAIKNASFRAALGTGPMFAAAPGSFIPSNAAPTPPFAQAVMDDAAFALDTVRRSRSYAEGVRHCIARGGRACSTAMLVGSLLGARFGVQTIPSEWLKATDGVGVICQQAIELAQWSWNPLRTQPPQ